ncbi:MAG: ABC transporter substrate-binding protein [Lachnospiraceae bacterium]|nr:ABC transporter substrate-binding protein [Lachnospiraceae bacterium]
MKKVIAMILAVVMAAAMLAACGGGNSQTTATTAAPADTETTQAAESGEETTAAEETTEAEPEYEINYDSEIIVGVSADIGSMNQFGASSSGVAMKKLLCYETLFFKDKNGEIQPLMGKEYTDDGNGKYTVTLFEGITDNQGNPFTASDVVFSIDQLKTQPTQSDLWTTIADYKAVDDLTFEITLDPETTGQMSDIFTRVSMVTEAGYNSSPDQMATYPIGTGGYALDADNSIAGSSYVFVRRDDYWQKDEQYLTERNSNYLKKITCKVYADTATLAAALQAGEIDFTSDLEVNGLSFFMTGEEVNPGYIKMTGENNAFVHLMFNCAETSQCSDINLRKAICYAIDAAGCAYTVYGDYGKMCSAPTNPNLSDSGEEFNYPDYFGYKEGASIMDFAYDQEQAKKFLDESNYDGSELTILVLPRTTVSGCAQEILNNLSAIGINAKLDTPDMSTYRTVRVSDNPTYDIELLGATSGDSYVYTSVKELNNKTYGNGLSRVMVPDDKLQQLFEAVGNQKTDSPEAVQELFDYITDNVYIYGLYYCDKTLIGKDSIVAGTTIPFFGPLFNSFVIQ